MHRRFLPSLYDFSLSVIGVSLLVAALSAYSYAVTAMLGPLEGVHLDARGELPPLPPLKVMWVRTDKASSQSVSFQAQKEHEVWLRLLERLPVEMVEISADWLPADRSQADVLILPWGSLGARLDERRLHQFLSSGGGLLGLGPASTLPLELARLESFFHVSAQGTAGYEACRKALTLALSGPTPSHIGADTPTLQVRTGAHPWGRRLFTVGEPLFVNRQALLLPTCAPSNTTALTLETPLAQRLPSQTPLPAEALPQSDPDAQPLLSLSGLHQGRTAWLAAPLSQVYGVPTDTTPLHPMLKPLLEWLARRPIVVPGKLPAPHQLEVALVAKVSQIQGFSQLQSLTERLDLPVTWFLPARLALPKEAPLRLNAASDVSLFGETGLKAFARRDRPLQLMRQLQHLNLSLMPGPRGLEVAAGYFPPGDELNAELRTAAQQAGFSYVLHPEGSWDSPPPYRRLGVPRGIWQVVPGRLQHAAQVSPWLLPRNGHAPPEFQTLVLQPEGLESATGQPTAELKALEEALKKLKEQEGVVLRSLSSAVEERQGLADVAIRAELLRPTRLHVRVTGGSSTMQTASVTVVLPESAQVTEVINHDLRTPTLSWKEGPGLLSLTITPLETGRVLDYFVGLKPVGLPSREE